MKQKQKPCVYVIAGPNGAGKTTFAREFLPGYVNVFEFVNADAIAAGLSPLAPDRAAIEAGKMMISRIRCLIKKHCSFGFETTLAGRSYIKLIKEICSCGYDVHIFFLWLPCADLAIQRVEQRVRKGGHSIPSHVIKRRYLSGWRNFVEDYRHLVESWSVWDLSLAAPAKIASYEDKTLWVKKDVRYATMIRELKKS